MSYDSVLASYSPSAWYKLNDTTGSTVADSSGNGYTGTVTGSPTFGQPGPILSNPSDTSIQFTGSQYITSSAPAPLTNASMVGWFYQPVRQGNDFCFGYRTSLGSSSTEFYVLCTNSSGTLECRFNNVLGTSEVTINPVTLSAWHMISLRYNTSTFYVDVDGTPYSNIAASGVLATDTTFAIGSWSTNGPVFYYIGYLAQIAVFPVFLTGLQISTLYSASLGSTVLNLPPSYSRRAIRVT